MNRPLLSAMPSPQAPLPVEPLAAERARRGWVITVAVAGAANVLAGGVILSAVNAAAAGRGNADPPLIFGPADAGWALLWIATAGVLVTAAALARGAARHWAAAALLLGATAAWVGGSTRALPGERYATGFRQWAATAVDGAAICRWHAALPPVAAVTPIPTSAWPPAVRSLKPASVEQLPGGRGVVLRWGVLATWGTARQVYVAPAPADAPPADPHFLWTQVDDRLWAAVSDGG